VKTTEGYEPVKLRPLMDGASKYTEILKPTSCLHNQARIHSVPWPLITCPC